MMRLLSSCLTVLALAAASFPANAAQSKPEITLKLGKVVVMTADGGIESTHKWVTDSFHTALEVGIADLERISTHNVTFKDLFPSNPSHNQSHSPPRTLFSRSVLQWLTNLLDLLIRYYLNKLI